MKRAQGRTQAAVACVVGVALVLAAGGCTSKSKSSHGTSASQSPDPMLSTSPSPSPSASSALFVFGYPAMWPFPSQQAADAWQVSYRNGGNQPWHLDAEQTALRFSSGFLGYTDMTHVTASKITGSDAHISVGYASQAGKTSTAAIVHVVRFGKEADSPWEVVGTDDTTLTLTTPGYGTPVGSPMVVGGRITGVDESIKVQVLQPSSPKAIGVTCCVAGGGDNQPWKTTVSYSSPIDPVLTVAASTGGHVKDVERFAVTAVRPH